MPLTEKWRMVNGAVDMLKHWVNNIPYPIQIKIYGSKRFAKYIEPKMEFFCIKEGVRITVPLTEVLELIEEYNNADPAEENGNDESGDIE